MRILDIDGASDFTRLSKATLYKYAQSKRVPFIKIGGRVLFDSEKLEAWLAAHGHEANDTEPAAVGDCR